MWKLILCIFAVNLGCGLVSCMYETSDIEGFADTIWATVNEKDKTVLVALNVASDYTEDFDHNIDSTEATTECKHQPAWMAFQKEKIARERSTGLSINRMSDNEFPSKLFYHFCKLERFEMTHQHLEKVEPEYFENAQHLRFLNLSHNAIERIGRRSFGNQTYLISIDLSFNQIEFIDEEAFEVFYLTEFYLDHNRLTTINWDQFGPFRPLNLTLNDNNIAHISGIKKDLNYMNLFDISNNPLEEEIQVDSGRINLQNTGVERVFIFSFTSRLNAQNNKISEIVVSVDYNPLYDCLKSLNLSKNLLSSVSNISELTSLEVLDLSYNKLKILDENTFLNLSRLQKLSLGHNNIQNLNLDILVNTINLEYLDISYNNLGVFQLNVTFPKLEELHIEGNNLTIFDRDIKQQAPNLVRIGINDNNWECFHLTYSIAAFPFDGIVLVAHKTIDDGNILYDTQCFDQDISTSTTFRYFLESMIKKVSDSKSKLSQL